MGEQIKLIGLRVERLSELIHNACKKNFNDYLSSYSAQQKFCTNPFGMHETNIWEIRMNFKGALFKFATENVQGIGIQFKFINLEELIKEIQMLE